MIIGLRLLQELMRAFELSIDEKGRKVFKTYRWSSLAQG
jgi:hypothetical protein